MKSICNRIHKGYVDRRQTGNIAYPALPRLRTARPDILEGVGPRLEEGLSALSNRQPWAKLETGIWQNKEIIHDDGCGHDVRFVEHGLYISPVPWQTLSCTRAHKNNRFAPCTPIQMSSFSDPPSLHKQDLWLTSSSFSTSIVRWFQCGLGFSRESGAPDTAPNRLRKSVSARQGQGRNLHADQTRVQPANR